MQAYRVTKTDDDLCPIWVAGLRDAQDSIKVYGNAEAAPEARVELVEVGTTKEEILAYLNGSIQSDRGYFPLLRTWKLGPRGGLVECPNGE